MRAAKKREGEEKHYLKSRLTFLFVYLVIVLSYMYILCWLGQQGMQGGLGGKEERFPFLTHTHTHIEARLAV